MEKTFRVFWALDLPNEVINDIVLLQNKFKEKYPKLKYVMPNNIHITIHFLGDMKQKSIIDLIEYQNKELNNIKGINISMDNIGVFPNYNKPRVIWLSIKEGKNKLYELHNKTKDIIKRINHPIDNKPFSPHITIARVPNWFSWDEECIQFFKTYKQLDMDEFLLKELTLYKSVLTPSGPIYTVLNKVKLK